MLGLLVGVFVTLLVLFFMQRKELRLFNTTSLALSSGDGHEKPVSIASAAAEAEHAANLQELREIKVRLALLPTAILANPRPLTVAERQQFNRKVIYVRPELAAIRHRRDRRVIQRYFGELLAEANLPAAQMERLRDLLVETAPLGTGPGDARAREVVERDIEALLGNRLFQTYRDIASTYMQVFASPYLFQLRLADEGIPLASHAHARELIIAERDSLRAQGAAKQDAAWGRRDYYARAAKLLTPQQLESLRAMDAESDAAR